MKIISPMPWGNGAHVIHSLLAERIAEYNILSYNPYLSLMPGVIRNVLSIDSDFDIIHAAPDYGSYVKIGNKPLVVTFHNFVLDPFMNDHSSYLQRIYYTTLLKYYTQKALLASAKVTAVSNFTANLIRTYLDYKEHINVIYNGIDTNTFIPSPSQQKRNIKVLFSGNLTRRKGAYLLPLIADRLSDDIEILYTCGLRAVPSLCNHPRLKNIGSFSYADMPKVYQEADILLFPTVREGFGLAAAEAMACGLPVVASDCSSLPELIEDNRGGYLCKLGNVEEFASRINLLADSPKLRQEMGEFNRSRSEKLFTIERMITEYKNLFEKTLDESGG